MTGKRTYAEACGIPRALDLIGERWTLMVVRELLLGPKRFTDLRAGLPNVSPDVLSQRLRELEANQLVRKRKLPPPAPAQVYELTPRGAALEPVLIALGRWGGAYANPPAEDMTMSLDAHVLSLVTLFRPDLAGDLDTTVELRFGDERYRARVVNGEMTIVRGEAPLADLALESDPGTLLGIAHGRIDFDEAVASGALTVEGDREAAAHFMTLCPLPVPVA